MACTLRYQNIMILFNAGLRKFHNRKFEPQRVRFPIRYVIIPYNKETP